MLHVIFLAIALAMDAAAVSATLGAARPGRQVAVRAAVVFGSFQGGMAGLGALGGLQLAKLMGPWLGALAAIVLTVLGVRMLWVDEHEDIPTALSWKVWATLGIATAVDALAAGVSLPLFDVPVMASVAIIGGVTALLAMGSAIAGRALGQRFGKRSQQIGGIVLVVLGVWALWSTLASG